MKQFTSKIVAFSLVILFSQFSFAQVVLIANPSAPSKSITVQQAANIFLGKANSFPGGGKVIPIDQEKGEAPRSEFYAKIIKKDGAQLNAYWSRRIFTGKGQPPKVVLDDDEVIELVSKNPNIIGYVDASSLTDSVIVVLKVK